MRTGVIYLATVNADVDKCYIGYTVNFKIRKWTHLKAQGDNHFHNAIRKYGAESVTWQILEEDIPEHRLPDREELWIAYYNTYSNGLNMTEGGESPPMSSPEVVAKMQATQREKAARGELYFQSAEFSARQSALLQEKVARGEHSSQQPEWKAKNSAIQKAKVARGEHQSQCPKLRARWSATRKAMVARGEHPSLNRTSVAKRERTKRKNRGILDWIDMLREDSE